MDEQAVTERAGNGQVPRPLALADEGPAAPPRANGELVFDAPWQSRAFGLAAALVEADRFRWSDFQTALISQVAQADSEGRDDYWGCWRDALLVCCETADLISAAQAYARTEQLLARPAGHDHRH